MEAEDPAGPGLDVDLLAASLRADASDTSTFTEALADKLTGALGSAVRIERRRDGLFGPKRVCAIRVDAGGDRLELRVAPAGLEATRARVSGGITLKTEPLPVEQWITILSRALAEQARQNERTRLALERLLLG